MSENYTPDQTSPVQSPLIVEAMHEPVITEFDTTISMLPEVELVPDEEPASVPKDFFSTGTVGVGALLADLNAMPWEESEPTEQ